MKNKTSILTGTRHFFYALLVSIIFCGCQYEPINQQRNIFISNQSGVQILTIDSCEYVWCAHDLGSGLTHKGNCKYCAERSKK